MTANTQEDTMASTPKGHSEWCSECYKESIGRLCKGYTLVFQKKAGTKDVPGLDTVNPMLAIAVRRSRDVILGLRRGDPDRASEHPQHAGA